MTASDRHSGSARDAGMSLGELLVAIGLLGLIGTLVTATAITSLRAFTASQVRLDDAVQGELGLAAVSKVLRTAVLPEQLDNQSCTGCQTTAITSASGKQVRFYANLNNTGAGPSLVTFCVTRTPRSGCGTPPAGAKLDVDASLVQDTQAPLAQGDGYTFCDRAAAGCVVRSRVVARHLPLPMRDVFTFYDYDGASMGSGALGVNDLRRISSVDVIISVRTRTDDGRYQPRTALTRVRLPNVEINVVNTT